MANANSNSNRTVSTHLSGTLDSITKSRAIMALVIGIDSSGNTEEAHAGLVHTIQHAMEILDTAEQKLTHALTAIKSEHTS